MLISLVLTAFMGATTVVGLALRKRAPLVSGAFVLGSGLGAWFAWFPQQLTAWAQFMGVGRGADLALYLGLSFCVLALAAVAVQLRHLQLKFTRLAREVALQQAVRPGDGSP